MMDKYFYPLYEKFDKDFFNKLKLAVQSDFAFHGGQSDKGKFVKDLLILQLIKDYRKHLKIICKHLDKKTDINLINGGTSKINFSFDTSWVDFKIEKEMISMAKRLKNADLTFKGSDKKFNEFVLRYLLTIWLADWIGPLYAILKKTENDKYIFDLRELNKLLSLWDFTGIFDK
jgi:hypothetical protein